MPALYVQDCYEELRQIGELGFGARYTNPVLVVQSFAGKLRDGAGSGGTLVSERPDIHQASQLIGRVFVVKKAPHSPPGPISVGRTADNDIAIPEYSISKRHCVLRLEMTGPTLTDVGSTNGTLLEGQPVPPKKPMPLRDGSQVTLGRFVFAFHSPGGFLKMLKALS